MFLESISRLTNRKAGSPDKGPTDVAWRRDLDLAAPRYVEEKSRCRDKPAY